jgi:ABC-2 type transport system ATP-binding protein
MLEIKKFSKTYRGGVRAVDRLTLHVEPGDLCAFIGHNGAGKSTTIKAIAGVLSFEEGEIAVGGHSVREEPMACKKLLAYIPDNPDLYEHLTGIQYLNFIGDIFGIPSEVRTERIARYSGLFDLEPSLGDLISSYSHGMKQKLALISAVLHDPKLLILDEPFVGLDPLASRALKDLMRALCADGCAIFFSTHVLEVAEKLCNKVAVIHQGRLLFTGTMSGLLGRKKGASLEDIYLGLLDGTGVKAESVKGSTDHD